METIDATIGEAMLPVGEHARTIEGLMPIGDNAAPTDRWHRNNYPRHPLRERQR
jgi:hypothetical protein